MKQWPHLLVMLCIASLASVGCARFRGGKSLESDDTCRQLSRQGISAMELGKWYEAESFLRRAAQASPTDADARRHLAETLWQRGDHAAAIAEIEAARELGPSNPYTAVRAGQMLLSAGQIDQAAACAAAAIAAAPRLGEAWVLRGEVAARQGRSDDALADFHRALSIAPNSSDALWQLAALHHARGEHQRCLTTVHHWLDCHPPGQEPAEALVLEGQTYLALGRAAQAGESFQLAAARGDRTTELLCLQADAAIAGGRADEAIRFAQQALAQDATHPAAQQLAARLSSTTTQR